jgi:hypothetical protein
MKEEAGLKMTRAKILRGVFFPLLVALLFSHFSYGFDCSLGIKPGASLSNFWGKDDLSWASRSSGVVGITGFLSFSLQFNKWCALQPELGYAHKGKFIQLDYSSYLYNGDSLALSNLAWQEKYRFEYIEIPVLVKFSIPLKLPVAFSMYGGPQVDFLYSAGKYINDAGMITWLNVKDESNPYDLGASIGCTCEIPFFHGTIIVDERISQGFITTSKVSSLEKQVSPAAKNSDRKNRTIYCMVGYAYKF